MSEHGRNGAIDMLRGLVMFLMVTVNDFWTVSGVPHVLEHYGTHEDGMGLSDIVYPLFLFVMGMAVPYAVDRRYEKGYSPESTLGHILSRTFALLVMGVFLVNVDRDFSTILGIGQEVFQLMMLAGFFLVWNAWPRDWKTAKWLRIGGAALLLFLVVIFRSSRGGLMQARWWGILGLIGWTYLFTATAYLLARKKPGIMALLWLGAMALNILTAPTRGGDPLIDDHNLLTDFARALHIDNGNGLIMALGGAVTTLVCRRFSGKKASFQAVLGVGAILILVAGGFLSHQFQIISKNIGTLPWCLYSCAIGVAAYLLLRLLEKRGLTHWYAPFRPAGIATLTVYLMPYLYESITSLVGLEWPDWLEGWVGITKCVLFAFLCIWTAALLGKARLKLKI